QGLQAIDRATDAWIRNDSNAYHENSLQVARMLVSSTKRSNSLLDTFLENQQKSYEAVENDSKRKTDTLTTVLTVIIFITIAAAFWFTNRIAHRLARISDNSLRLASGVPLLPMMKGEDEIAALDRSFHEMANDLEQATRRERMVIETARDIICVLDADGVLVMVNPAFETILGYLRPAVLDTVWLKYISAEDRNRANSILRGIVDNQPTEPFEVRMLKKDGSIVEVLVSAYWSETDKTVFAAMHDITARRQMDRMKQQFTAMITHDLRSPLTAIGGTLHLLDTGVYKSESEVGKTRIKEASQNIKTMLQLISDLLEMGKFDASMMTFDFKPTNIAAVIEDSIASVRASAEQRDVAIHSQPMDVELEVDGFRLVQVLVNLLSNAIKFSLPHTNVWIACTIRGDRLRIEVKDSGPGISKEDQEVIFEPFKQASQMPSTEQLKGTGLGLSICKSIVEAHKGSVGVESDGLNSKNGSTFWIELPVKGKLA
ncbi:MAG TPA: ATP-binding protein, partial [Chroococcales cyanobacterium]